METKQCPDMECDVVIAGCGVAGLYAALNLPTSTRVIMLSKGAVDECDSMLAQGGICVLPEGSDYDAFFEDTMHAGHYDNRRESVDIMIRSSRSVINDLLAMGVDLGVNYQDAEKGWSVSAVVKNLGGQLDPYDDEYEKMPVDLQIGASKRLVGTPLRFSASLVDLNHTDYKFINHWVFGLDVLFSQTMWVGMGYNLRRANEMRIVNGEEESSHGAGLSFGAGLNLDRLHINAAYGKYHVSSSSVLINLSYTL